MRSKTVTIESDLVQVLRQNWYSFGEKSVVRVPYGFLRGQRVGFLFRNEYHLVIEKTVFIITK